MGIAQADAVAVEHFGGIGEQVGAVDRNQAQGKPAGLFFFGADFDNRHNRLVAGASAADAV